MSCPVSESPGVESPGVESSGESESARGPESALSLPSGTGVSRALVLAAEQGQREQDGPHRAPPRNPVVRGIWRAGAQALEN